MSAATFFPSDPSPDLYSVLSLSRDPSPSADEIKAAYRRSALLYHPDKLPPTASSEDKEAANLKFQQVGFAYNILKDEKKRERYDKTGSMEEGEVLRSEAEWKDYFKELWKGEVNADTIEEFRQKYQGSDEELTDLLSSYTSNSGDFSLIVNSIMCSSTSDEERFIKLINNAISNDQVPLLPKWKKSSKDKKAKEKREKEATKEAKEAEEYAKELGVHDKLFGSSSSSSSKSKSKKASKEDSEDSLRALIQSNQSRRMESMMDSLEAKYGAGSKSSKGGKRKKEETEPSEEEFERIQKEMDARRAAGGSGGGGGEKKKSRKSK